MIHSCIYIGSSQDRGKGVFAAEKIPVGILVEVSPVVVMSQEERALLDQTRLHDYIFEWGADRNQCCMALGYIAVYNHAYSSNCEYEMDYEQGLIRVKTVRDIEAGEELFVNYNGDWNNQKPVWFDVK